MSLADDLKKKENVAAGKTVDKVAAGKTFKELGYGNTDVLNEPAFTSDKWVMKDTLTCAYEVRIGLDVFPYTGIKKHYVLKMSLRRWHVYTAQGKWTRSFSDDVLKSQLPKIPEEDVWYVLSDATLDRCPSSALYFQSVTLNQMTPKKVTASIALANKDDVKKW